MTARTPYDDDRSTYSRRALARLVLSHQASGLSDAAGSLAVTRYDEFSGAGGRVGEAAAAGHADRLVTSAVIYERERGSSWADIGRHLELSGPAAEERFAPAVEPWRAAFDVPYRLDETGRKRIPQLPTAAYDPARVIQHLDLWAAARVGYDDKHAVSGGLQPGHDEEETWPEKRGTEIDGLIRQPNLGIFLDLLSGYALHRPADSARDVVARAMESSKVKDQDTWHSYAMVGIFELLDIRLAVDGDGDLVSVVVAGAHSPGLRLRISTLLDVFA